MRTIEDDQVFCLVTGNIDGAIYDTKKTLDWRRDADYS